MVFDELLPKERVTKEIKFFEPNRQNLDLLFGLNLRQTLTSILIYLVMIMMAYIFLIEIFEIDQTTETFQMYLLFSFFIGIAAFVDQISNPDENSKTGYFILLALYYVIYKFTIFGGILWGIFYLLGRPYEMHYIAEALPFMTIFISWAIGQKVGYYLEHHRLLEGAGKEGGALTDIDKLKIFLYQVHRRSFLKMLIQRNKAKFQYIGKIEDPSAIEFQKCARLVSLNMANFLKLLKIKHLPRNKYVTFDQIEEIDFSRNKISEFSTYLFKIFPNVENIDLSKNKIKTITEDQQVKLLMQTGTVIVNFDGNPIFT